VQKNAEGDRVFGTTYLPERVDLPWEVEAGVAVQLGKRPLNIPWTNEDTVPDADTERWRRTNAEGQIEPRYKGARRMLEARYRAIPREKVLLATSVLVSGALEEAVGLESALSQKVDRSGQTVVASVRFGAEAEVIPWWLVLRGGSYVEPTRFRESSPRAHATAGFQVRLFRWSVLGLFDEHTIWRFSANGDVARAYVSTGFAIGTFL
jgi:hypothetical protein